MIPAQISILSLLLSYEEHKNALLKILNESDIPADTFREDFENIAGQVIATNTISFPLDELVPQGRGNVMKSFHTMLEC